MFDLHLSQIPEILIRVAIVYLVVLLGLRILGKREIAQLSVIDFVLVLLIANAVQNAMVGDDTSLLGGVVAASALFLVNFLIRLLILRKKRFNRLLEGEPVTLIYNGKMLHQNMRKVQITENELMAVIREHGVTDPAEVNLAILEVNGAISVLSHNYTSRSKQRNRIEAQ